MPRKFQFSAKKIKICAEKIQNSAEKIENRVEKIQKITNRVDWNLSKRVNDVITMLIALTKIP